jgi:chemotaxis protein CheD
LLSYRVSQLQKPWVAMSRLASVYQRVEHQIVVDANNYPQKVEEVRVDMAAMSVERRNVELLTSVGSCVAICLYDSAHKCGGLAHIMLPHSAKGSSEPLPSKYANTAVPALTNALRGVSGSQCRLTAKIAGGANMFAATCPNNLDVGAKNVAAVKAALAEHKIRLAAEDVGGMQGRRINFNIASGQITVKLHSGELRKL